MTERQEGVKKPGKPAAHRLQGNQRQRCRNGGVARNRLRSVVVLPLKTFLRSITLDVLGHGVPGASVQACRGMLQHHHK